MAFLNTQSDGKKMVDKVFKAAVKAKEAKLLVGDDNVVDATLGTLFDEDGNFVAFDSVWQHYNTIPSIQKAKYASSIQGNPSFRSSVSSWLFGTSDIPHDMVATPGGAGAVSSTIKNILNPGETLIKPNLAWGPYNTMAEEFNIKTTNYTLFDNDVFNFEDFKRVCTKVMKTQGKVLAIINDPCHNPSGYTMSSMEWDLLIEFINNLSEQGPVILLHDIAYVDFNTNPTWKQHFTKYKVLSNNAMVVIAFSLSKTFTAYGMRVGAAIAVTPNQEQRQRFIDAEIYSARSIWSTVNNSVMELFTSVTSTTSVLEAFLDEKQSYIDLIRERAEIFISEAKEVGLPLYPYKEGFFATIKCSPEQVEEINKRFQKHHIYTVEVAGGLRVALCSVPKKKLVGLAAKMNELIV